MSEAEVNPYSAPAASSAAEAAAPDHLYVGPEFAGGVGIRFAALLIDWGWVTALGVVGGVVGGIVLAILQLMGRIDGTWMKTVGENSLAVFFGSLLAFNLYFIVSQWVGGASLGKLILGLRVVRADFKWVGFWKSVGRTLAMQIDLLFFGWPAYSSMKDDPYFKRLGDNWAGTCVIRNAGLPENQRRSTGRVVAGVFAGTAANVITFATAFVLHHL